MSCSTVLTDTLSSVHPVLSCTTGGPGTRKSGGDVKGPAWPLDTAPQGVVNVTAVSLRGTMEGEIGRLTTQKPEVKCSGRLNYIREKQK